MSENAANTRPLSENAVRPMSDDEDGFVDVPLSDELPSVTVQAEHFGNPSQPGQWVHGLCDCCMTVPGGPTGFLLCCEAF
eukprot:326320-Rhodomonas_salina.1